jgi:parallel beta-helix repeat protein
LIALTTCFLPTAFAGEGKIPIWLSGTVINAPGRYIVTRNLVGAGTALTIAVGNVDVDLNGMTLDAGGAGGPVLQVVGGGSGDVVLRDGTLLNGALDVSAAGRRLVIEDLKIDGSPAAAVHLTNSANFVVRRVTISGSGAEGILVDGGFTKQGTIEDNLVRGSQGTAIRVVVANSLAVLGNRVEQTAASPGVFGIALETCEGCLVAENTVHMTGDNGIDLREFRGGKVYNNVVSRAGRHGIALDITSSGDLILNNVATNAGNVTAGGCGLFVVGEYHMIEGNTLNLNSGAGLRLASFASLATFGRNTARGNFGVGVGPCAGVPSLFPPNSCNDGGSNTTFGTNLIPGPPLF